MVHLPSSPHLLHDLFFLRNPCGHMCQTLRRQALLNVCVYLTYLHSNLKFEDGLNHLILIANVLLALKQTVWIHTTHMHCWCLRNESVRWRTLNFSFFFLLLSRNSSILTRHEYQTSANPRIHLLTMCF